MLKFSKLTGLAAVALVALVWAAPAQAQATRTWVSGVGDDVNPCSRTAPCKTFPGAISKTAPGGSIDCLDPAGFGALTVTKAITLECSEGAGEGGILVAGTNGITVNAGANDVVILTGLQIDGGPIGSNSLAGVRFIAGRVLEIQNCQIRNFTGGSPNGYGVSFVPAAGATTQQLIITDTTITTNGSGTGATGTGAAINVAPTGSGTVNVTLDRVEVVNNAQGVTINSTGMSGGAVTATISDSTLASSQTGLTVAGTTPVTAMLIRDRISNNAGFGIITAGSGSSVKVGYSTITGNGTSLIQAAGSLLSYGNNQIDGNGTNTLPGTTATH
ncbi:MAG: hypothetical protein WDM91_21745 [Rhizomicrobium sp.]